MSDESTAGDELVFMMGKFAAKFPTDRRYAKNHMWAKREGSVVWFGFSAYAVRLLQDVYFLEWSVDAPTRLREKQTIGNIESSKAESELYAPAAGTLTEFNMLLMKDPTPINVDLYGAGRLFAMECDEAGLLTPEQYQDHLAAAWKIAEKTIKGQMNE